jgi:hypothetical protein
LVGASAFPTPPRLAHRNERYRRVEVRAEQRHHACCEAVGLAAGEYELVGFGPRGAYTVYVRIYFGSRPTPAMRAEVQRALDRLQLPRPVR